ncbi:MAG: flagellar export chaperone FliS [Gammaproteobacteria bacterium]|jgi:flagellar protein FliS|nr:flagellar export chaperone FliS [Gammaproteobacteria bacterium]
MSAMALKAYQSVNTGARCADADRRELVVMMYDGAIDAVRLARVHLAKREYRAASAAASRASSIILGLRDTLDHGKGGDLAQHLFDFYSFLLRKLIAAAGPAGAPILTECEELLAQVREAWAAISPATVGAVNQRMFVIRS